MCFFGQFQVGQFSAAAAYLISFAWITFMDPDDVLPDNCSNNPLPFHCISGPFILILRMCGAEIMIRAQKTLKTFLVFVSHIFKVLTITS